MPEAIEDFTYELILFCMKWGMWYDGGAVIYSNGKRYCPPFDSMQVGDPFRGLKGVRVTTERPEDYMPQWERCGQDVSVSIGQKPDHILSMSIDGSLYQVLHDMEYIKKLSDLTPEGRTAILARTSFLEDLEDAIIDAESVALDPLDFYSYKEYQTLLDVLDDRAWLLDDIKTELEAKEILCSGNKHPVVVCIQTEFDEIFKKYDVWYDFKEKWWLTCYYFDQNIPELFQS